MNERPIDPFLAAWSATSGSDGFVSRPLVERALQEPGPWTRERLHAALAAILVQEPEQRDRFEEIFALWFGAEAGDQQAEILDLDAWLRAPVVQIGQAEDSGECLAADAKSLACTPQPVASVPRKRRHPGSWPFSALDATALLIAGVCALGDVRRPSPKPSTANAHTSVSDTDSVVERLVLPTQARNQKNLSASSRRRRTPTDRDLPGSALEEPAEKPQRNRANGFARPDDPVKRVTAGAPPDAELPAGHEGIRPRGRVAAAAGAEEPRTAPEAPMSQAQAIQTLSKAGIIKDEHRNGIGGLRWFYSKGSLDPEAILALDSLGTSIGLLFLEDSVLQLSPLRSLRRLKGLDLGWTKLSDVSALDGMPLAHLELSGTKVSNLAALKRMPLAYLDLAWTQVSDLSPLAGMRLTYLELSGTRVSDLSALKGMPLQWLDLSGTRVTDLSALKGMPLQWLDLSGTRVTDLSALDSLRLLRTLFVRGLLGSVKDWSPVPSGVRITPSPPTRQTPTQATSSKSAP
jgi:hypothetical protein